MKQYICTICGYIYDEALGIPSAGIAPGTKWENLPGDWVCPLCGAAKSDFKEKTDRVKEANPDLKIPSVDYKELSPRALSALCSNLARGCEKQYLEKESKLFTELADYFKAGSKTERPGEIAEIIKLVEKDLETGFENANNAAKAAKDRGALRALVWSEKVTRILNSILTRLEKEGEGFIEKTNVYVCTICGFVYVGDKAPELCPVCKVPSWKFQQIERSGTI